MRAFTILAAVLMTACGGPGDSSDDAAGGAGPGAGGSTGSGGAPTSGGIAGSGGGGPTGGAAGTGGDPGSGAFVPFSQDLEMAPLVAEEEAACLDTCGVAVACGTGFQDLEACDRYFHCSNTAARVDQESADLHQYEQETLELFRQRYISCLSAAAAHMTCVAGLDCPSYAAWWDEEPEPFPCSTEQYTETGACAGLYLFGY